MWTPKDEQAAANEYAAARARGNTHEEALRLVMTLAVERKAKSRTGDAQAAVAWLRSAATRGAPKAAALPFVDVIGNSLLTLTAKVEALENRLWSTARSGGTMTAEELNEVRQEMEMDPPVLPSATGTQDLLDHAIAQGARVATLQAKVEDLHGRLRTEEAERIRCRDGWAATSTEVARLKAQLVTAQHEVARTDAVLRVVARLTSSCVWCGDEPPGGMQPEALTEYIRSHVKMCPTHPIRALEAELARLKPSGQVAENVRTLRGVLDDEGMGGPEDVPMVALTRLAATAQAFDAAERRCAELERYKAGLTAENERLSHRLMMMTDLRDSYRKGGTMEHVRANLLEAEKDWWRMLALRPLVLGVMVRAQWERYASAAEQPVDGCPGAGKCHGPLSWCARCGEVGLLCDMNGSCHLHRERWQEYVLEHTPVAKFAREEGHEAGRREAEAEARKAVDAIQSKLRRARTDAWAEAVDVINGEPLTSQEAREAMAPVLVQWAEREQAVHPFLALARDRLARVSYESIPLEACTRLLKAFNAGEERHNG